MNMWLAPTPKPQTAWHGDPALRRGRQIRPVVTGPGARLFDKVDISRSTGYTVGSGPYYFYGSILFKGDVTYGSGTITNCTFDPNNPPVVGDTLYCLPFLSGTVIGVDNQNATVTCDNTSSATDTAQFCRAQGPLHPFITSGAFWQFGLNVFFRFDAAAECPVDPFYPDVSGSGDGVEQIDLIDENGAVASSAVFNTHMTFFTGSNVFDPPDPSKATVAVTSQIIGVEKVPILQYVKYTATYSNSGEALDLAEFVGSSSCYLLGRSLYAPYIYPDDQISAYVR